MQPSTNTTSAALRRALAVLAVAAALAIAMTWPLARGFGELGRTASGDGQYAIWNVAWVAHALTTSPWQLFDANIFYPHRSTLAFSEANIVAGIVAIPAWLLTGNPYAAHNSAVLFAFTTSLLGAWLLARYVSGCAAAAAVAAVTFAFTPYFFAHTAHIQLLFAGGIPLSLLLLHRLVDAPSPGGGVRLGVTLGIQALACAYYGIFAGLAVGYAAIVLGMTRGRWRERKYWTALAIGAVLSGVVVAPFFLPYVEIRGKSGFERTLADSVRYSANLPSYLASSAHAHEWLLPYAGSLGRWNEVLFPGFAALLLGTAGAVVAVRGAGRGMAASAGISAGELAALYGSLGVLVFWASFGPGAGLYTLLYYAVPVFSFLRAPSRFGPMISLVLALFSAMALAALLQKLEPSRRAAAATVLCGVVLLELNRVPFPWERAPRRSAVYAELARLPRAPLAEFPFYGDRVI